MPGHVRFTGNVSGPRVVRSSRTGFPPLRVCRSKSMERAPLTLRRGEPPSDGSRETTPYRGFDHTSDTGTPPMNRPMPREVTDERSESLGRRTLASVSRETVLCARWHDGIIAADTALVPKTNRFHVGATGTAEAGQPVPRKRRTLLLLGSSTTSSGMHVPAPGKAVSRGTPKRSESAETGAA